MKKKLLVLFLVCFILMSAFGQIYRGGDEVVFIGFGVDGDIELEDVPKFDVFQGIRVKNISASSKRVMVGYFLMGNGQRGGDLHTSEIVSLSPGEERTIKIGSMLPTPRLLKRDVLINVLN